MHKVFNVFDLLRSGNKVMKSLPSVSGTFNDRNGGH
jgi:hypothetical protein